MTQKIFTNHFEPKIEMAPSKHDGILIPFGDPFHDTVLVSCFEATRICRRKRVRVFFENAVSARWNKERSNAANMISQFIFFLSIFFIAWCVLSSRCNWPELCRKHQVESLRPLLILPSFRHSGLAFLFYVL